MVISKVYPASDNSPTGALLKRGNIVSVQVETVSGAIATGGTYQLQSSNSQDLWTAEGSNISGGTSGTTITDFTVNKQAVRVICLIPPTGGQKVTIYADGIRE